MTTEEQFAREIYPGVRRIAHSLAYRIRDAIPADDLAQCGMLGALALFREHDGALQSLALTAARREMLDVIRHEMRRAPVTRVAIDEQIAENTPSWDPDPEQATARKIDRERVWHLAKPAEREIFERLGAGETLAQIGAAKGLHFSRISQIKSAAIRRIRRKLTAQPT